MRGPGQSGFGQEYDPELWDPTSGRYSPGPRSDTVQTDPGIHPVTGKAKLPFEGIETVLAMIVYSKQQFRDAGMSWKPDRTWEDDWSGNNYNMNTYQYTDAERWVLENGQIIVFNPYLGDVIKTYD